MPRKTMHTIAAVCLLLIGALLMPSSIAPTRVGDGIGLAPASAQGAPAIRLVPVVSGLNNALTVVHAGDGSDRLFIVLQRGQIVIFDGTSLLPRPFLDLSRVVSPDGGELGLLGLAFHPSYASNGRFYVHYANRRGQVVIARFTVSQGNPNVANPLSARVLMRLDHPFPSHYGGQLQFGPDGYLYLAMGDGGDAGDPSNNAQNLGTLLGKILRIDVDRGSPYAIPASNPFVGVPGARPEIWAYGLRNPWRFSFDRLTGDAFIADVGQDQWEEINFQAASSAGGENYGWRVMEGTHCFNPPTGCDSTGLVLPILEYSHEVGCSVIGGFRYRGAQIADLAGRYLYGDFCEGLIWRAGQDQAGAWSTELLLDTPLLISSFGEGPDGELYVLSYEQSGTLFKIASNVASAGR